MSDITKSIPKPTKSTKSIKNLTVDLDLNVRTKDNYDLPQMKGEILQHGRILKPIIINGDTNKVLQGNRRALAGQELYDDPKCPVEVKEALSKVDVIVYSGLTPEQEMAIIVDHNEKPLGREELVRAIWRLSKQFYSEAQIILMLYYSLAKFTGNEKKINTLPKEEPARTNALKKWLHGTVGNYILAAGGMGDYIRNQFLMTMRSEDGRLAEGEKIEIKLSREAVNALTTAKNEDVREGGWDPEKGGVKFNELIEKMKAELNGEAEAKVKRPSVKDLKEKVSAFRTGAIRKILLIAAGETGAEVQGVAEDDERLHRLDKNMQLLGGTHYDKLKPEFQQFVRAIIDMTPVECEKYILANCCK